MTFTCENSKTSTVPDIRGDSIERLVQEKWENQVVIDLNKCIGHYTCQVNKHILFILLALYCNTWLFSFHSFQLLSYWIFFSFFLFLFSLSFGTSPILKLHAIHYCPKNKVIPIHARFPRSFITITIKNDRKERDNRWLGLNRITSGTCINQTVQPCKRCPYIDRKSVV